MARRGDNGAFKLKTSDVSRACWSIQEILRVMETSSRERRFAGKLLPSNYSPAIISHHHGIRRSTRIFSFRWQSNDTFWRTSWEWHWERCMIFRQANSLINFLLLNKEINEWVVACRGVYCMHWQSWRMSRKLLFALQLLSRVAGITTRTNRESVLFLRAITAYCVT